ncbi:MAG: Thiol-disulfide isomerase or thioredoxin [Chitinophagaceae bacterium]|nr:Thiol-disulfide isomerase or thioredoxin [Chitinophagaceae bacterium]
MSLPGKVLSQTHELQIGEQVPEMRFNEVYNFKTQKPFPFKMSDLKGKLIILDFWSTVCEPCLEGFPKLDSMQKHFKDRIQIMTVTPQSTAVVTNFLKIHTAVFKPSLPFITGDKVLSQMFPHTGVPFQVWISPTGKVLYLADSYNLTAQNIDSVLAGNHINLLKASKNVYLKTLFDEQWEDQVEFSSYLTHAKNGLHIDGPVTGKGFTEGGTRTFLYQKAYDGLTDHKYELLRPGRLILETKDSSKYINTQNGREGIEWTEKNGFWYQISVPEDYKKNIFKLMIEDLNRYFNLDASIQKKMVKSLVLIRTSQNDKLKSKGGLEGDHFYPVQKRNIPIGSDRYLKNKPFSILVERIKNITEYSFHKPFLDSTGYSGNIDIKMEGEVLDNIDLNTFKEELNKYDLDLVERDCPIFVLVLREK